MMFNVKPLPHLQDEDHTLPDKRQRMLAFLKATPVGVLSTVSPDNNPYGAVVYFSVTRDFIVSVLTKTETKKYDNLKHNDHVMLTVFEPLQQTTVQITGVAEEITRNFEVNEIAEANLAASLATSEAGIPAIMKLDAGEYAAFKIRPVEIRMAVFARPDSGEAKELFEIIDNFPTK